MRSCLKGQKIAIKALLQHSMHIYSEHISNRLLYITSFISDFYGHPFLISDNLTDCQESGFFINYSSGSYANSIQINPITLLFEENNRPQNIEVKDWNNTPAFFFSTSNDIPFDIFSAIFYLISRYEEYLPHNKDVHGRYLATNSLAYKHQFIEIPVVDRWLKVLAEILDLKFNVKIWNRKYHFISTIDVDKAFAYTNQGFILRNVGFLRSIMKGFYKERKQVLKGKKGDPYNTYDYIQSCHNKYHIHPIFFIQCGARGRFDKNISIKNQKMKALVKNIALWAKVGLHPSYQSFLKPRVIRKEMTRLNHFKDIHITRSRQHYLRFQLPTSYTQLLQLGISEEYSMGYAEVPGFRAGTSHPFYFFNLQNNQETSLKVIPLILMDVSMANYLKLDHADAQKKISQIIESIKAVDGTFTSLWHNSSFCALNNMEGWSSVFEYMLQQAAESN